MHDVGHDAARGTAAYGYKDPIGHLLLGTGGLRLVFPPILSRLESNSQRSVAQDMALVQSVLTLFAVTVFFLALASLGNLTLQCLKWEMESEGEHFLVAIGVGLVTTEILLFFVELTQHIRQGCWLIAAFLCVVLIVDRKSALRKNKRMLQQLTPASVRVGFILTLIAIASCVGFLSSLAPLTGSDALHYHFTVQKEILEQGFHPIFSNSHSFLCGQHHLLILFGLALGSEKLALGLIFLGGVLTAASLACLASMWARDWVVAGFTLLFLLTPVVFWQISSSGAPDIFMAFLASAAVMILRRAIETKIWRQAILSGYLVGGIAGAKYTGCLIAAAFAIAVLIELRSKASVSLFFLGALTAGIWPYLRNISWTGDPIFPFLSARLSPHLVTSHAMQSLASDTGASSIHGLDQLFPFLFFAAMQRRSPGFWDFFGPTVLALALLLLFAFRNTRAWRVSLLVWFLSGLGIFFASGLPRFLLPIFPVALACAAAGLEITFRKQWRIASRTTAVLLILMVCVGGFGFALYLKAPLRTAIGMQSEKEYLIDRSQDFEVTEAVNQLLGGREKQQKTLVFIRHLYYLNIPFVNGDPDTSFEVDPERLQTPKDWKSFLQEKGIGYVVRSPGYPEAIAQPLGEMERTGDLMPFAEADVQNLQGKRIDQNRIAVSVVILKVKP